MFEKTREISSIIFGVFKNFLEMLLIGVCARFPDTGEMMIIVVMIMIIDVVVMMID